MDELKTQHEHSMDKSDYGRYTLKLEALLSEAIGTFLLDNLQTCVLRDTHTHDGIVDRLIASAESQLDWTRRVVNIIENHKERK